MQLYGCELLCVILTLVCLALSQNSTPVKTAGYGTTSPWPTGKAITIPTTLLKTAVYGTTPPWPITPTTLLNPRIVDVTASSNTLFDDIYLKCVVQGNPSPNVWWTKNGRYIQVYNIEFQNNNRTLIITRAASDDVGTYYCHARNKVSYVNAPFVLNLIYPLSTFIYTPNDYVELYNGEKDVDIRCFGAGYPNVRVTWKRNGVEILEFSNSSLNTRVYQERLKLGLTSVESDLSFKEFYCNDTGIYTCETSRDGSDYVATKSIELKCNSSDSSQSTLFTPLSPTTIVPKPTRSLGLFSVLRTLRFTESLSLSRTQLTSTVIKSTITPTDSRNFLMSTPIFTKVIGTIASQLTRTVTNFTITPTPSSTSYSLATPSISINIPIKPRILNITASPGRLYYVNYLKCEVQGNPSPDVWWTKNGSYVHGRDIRYQDENRTLIISGVLPKHIGTYYCHARNSVSYVNASLVFDVIDLPDTLILPRVDFVELYNGQKDVRIWCNGDGYPNPRASWNKNGTEIFDSSNKFLNIRVYQIKHKQHLTSASCSLYFKEFYCHDAGIYTCKTSIDGYDYVDTKSIELACNSSNSSQSTLFTPLSSTTIVPTATSSLGLSLVMPTENLGPMSSQLMSTVTNFVITPTPSSTLYSLASSSISIVPAIPENLYVMPANPIVVENSYIVLSCDCWCSIRPHWFKNNQSIRYDGSGSPYTLLANGSLRINASRWTNTAGNYSCEIRVFSWRVRSKQVKLEILSLPDTTLFPRDDYVELYNGQKDVRIWCYGNGYPNALANWNKNGTAILDSLNTRLYQARYKYLRSAHSSLNFKEFYCHDAGIYTCKTSIDGYDYVDTKSIELRCILSSSTQSTLSTQLPATTFAPTPSVPANLYVMPDNPIVVENSSIVLSCDCADCAIRPHWFKNNQSIRYDGSGSPYTLLANGNLRINATRWTNTAGNYSCEIRTFFWRVRSKQVKLEIWYLDDCYVTGDHEIYRGQNISLTCHGNGVPYPTFIWYLGGQQFKTNSRIRIQGNQLNIFNATLNHGGEYKCGASNQIGRVWDGVNVTVKDIPSIGISSNASKYTLEGTTIRFTCQREDRSFLPIQKIELVKDGVPFYQRLVKVQSSFWYYTTQWYSARQNDAGKYQCKVTIGAASRYSSPFYLIIGIPSGPVVLEKNKTSTTGIKISWKPISRKFWNGEQITFEVLVVSSVDHTKKKSFVTKTTSAIISGLRPATTYIVSVAGSTVFGPVQNVTVTVETKKNKNNKKFQIGIRLTNYEFSNNLLDETSSQYKNLESKLTNSLDGIFRESTIGFQYIGSSVSRFEKGSVVVLAVLSLDSKFKNSDSPILVQEINKVGTIAGYEFDKSYTRDEDFDECEDADTNTCHEYAHCDNAVGTYICRCFEGFFGDGNECQGPPQIISKSPANITQLVETNVTLVCTVIANPNPTMLWKRMDPDGKFIEIKRTSKKSDGNHTIYNARLEDSGKYLCNASNTLGYDSYTTQITIKPVIVNINVEIKLSNKTFKEELKNKSSPAYKELEQDVYVELYNFFNNTPGFEDVEILGFTNGSVQVIFRVIVKVLKPSKETNDVVAVKIGRQVYKQLKTGRIGNILVSPDALQLKVPPPPPVNVTHSDVRETRVHIYWKPPELHELFSIERYYITYLKLGEKKWSNNTISNKQYNVQLDDLESDTFYILKIVAENAYGLGKESGRMEIKTMKVKVISPWYYIGPIIAVACIILLVIIICSVRRVSFSRAWQVVENGTFNSDKNEQKTRFQMTERKKLTENTFTNVGFSDTLPKSAWKEILRTSIEISNETPIPGEFGVTVARGTFSCSNEKRKESCSVKMLKESATADDHCDLINELTTISAISCHENIVNLIGACTSEDGPLLLVLEFCSHGTLESNLREDKKSEQMFMKKNKINLANEIAKGMRHLTDTRIIHRDLAAKNILLTDDFTPKISNFGLSRDVYEQDSYQKLASGNLRTRWLAIESLTDGLHTTKSDVWSFAVVMWEIETGGDTPYQEFEVTELVSQINKGYRLSKPKETSDETYKLMLRCWDVKPDDRPTFYEIVEITEMYLGNDQSKPFTDVPLN